MFRTVAIKLTWEEIGNDVAEFIEGGREIAFQELLNGGVLLQMSQYVC